MNFDLVDFRLLLAVVQTGSLSKAAAALPMALSAASSRIRRFEQQCGVAVFSRGADGMTLTPAGRLVLDRVQRILGEAEQLHDVVRDLTGERRITLRLAGTTVANGTFLPAALGPFLADFPQVDLQLAERTNVEVLDAVRAQEAEIGVFDNNVPTDGVVTLPFRAHRLVLLIPANHPLCGLDDVRFRDALQFPFVCLAPERAMQQFLQDMAVQNARSLKIRVQAPSFNAMVELVAQQAGVAVVPETVAQARAGDARLARVAIADPWATRELRLCFRNWDGLSTHARQLLGYLAPETRPEGRAE